MIHKVVCKNLCKDFKIRGRRLSVLKDLNFSFEEGKIYGLIGGNMSGKTTFLRTISGIYTPSGGTVKILGRVFPIINLKEGFKSRLNLRENLLLIGGLAGIPRKEIMRIRNEVLNFADLKEFEFTKLSQFSEGMKERAILALAVFSSWDILLLDESFSSCDKKFKDKFIKFLVDNRSNKTIICVSHEISLLKKFCDVIIELEEGRLFSLS